MPQAPSLECQPTGMGICPGILQGSHRTPRMWRKGAGLGKPFLKVQWLLLEASKTGNLLVARQGRAEGLEKPVGGESGSTWPTQCMLSKHDQLLLFTIAYDWWTGGPSTLKPVYSQLFDRQAWTQRRFSCPGAHTKSITTHRVLLAYNRNWYNWKS